MTRKLGLLLLAIGPVVGGAGCVSCRYRGYEESLHAADRPACPPLVRQRVHLFMTNGADVLELSGMLGLRDGLCHAGYSKVYYAQRVDCAWYEYELRRVARDDPGGRVVLLGFGTSAPTVHRLALDALRDGVPVDAVVFLDPVGLSGDLAGTLPVPTVVVRSHNWRGGRGLVGTEDREVANVGHFSLPGHPVTVAAVADLLADAAGRVRPEYDVLPHQRLRDDPVPTPRPVDPLTYYLAADEWDFLKPHPGFPAPPPPPEVVPCRP